MNAERLREVFDYNASTGVLSWRVRTSNRVKVGANAACPSGNGYLRVRLDSVLLHVHRVVFTMMVQDIPKGWEVDHINGIRSDNRITNLRLVPPIGNRRNQGLRFDNTSGANGVYWSKNARKWLASIGVEGATVYIGCFSDFEDAVAARKAAEVKYGFHENHGQRRGE